jgi:transposase-like protein
MYIVYVYVMCFVTVLLLSFFLFIAFRDAVTGSFPGVTHLMCYFHVVKNCKEKLHSYVKDVQQDILHNVQQLHSSVSAQECNALMTRLIPKWTKVVPDFLTYFLHQWMVSDSFGSWKVYCIEPSKAVL